MRKLLVIVNLILMSLVITALGAQGFPGGNGGRPQKPGMHGDRGGRPDNTVIPDKPDNGEFGIREFKGYLIDKDWGKTGKDDAGKDIISKPSRITLKHLQSKASMDAGYGLLMETPGRDYAFFKFDTSGNLMSEDFVMKRCKKKNKIYIKVKGYMDVQTLTITVTSIEQSSMTSNAFIDGRPRPEGDGDGPPDIGNQ